MTFVCGPGGRQVASEHDAEQIRLFAEYLKGELSLEQYFAECARLEGTNPTQEGTNDGRRPD